MSCKRKLLGLKRWEKQFVVVFTDVFLSLFATWLAFSFRLDQWHWPIGNQWIPYAICAVVFIPFFSKAGLYRAIFRYSGTSSLAAVTMSVGLYGLVLFCILLVFSFPQVPRSIGISQPIFFFGFVLGIRLAASHFLKRVTAAGGNVRNVLIYGAGEAGAQAFEALFMTHSYRVVGFLDDLVSKHGQRIHDTTIFSPTKVQELVLRLDVTDVLIALPSASIERRREIINSLLDLRIRVRTIPGIVDLARGADILLYGKDLQIIDLLDRDPIKSNLDVEFIQSRVVMVTGAGGSIGSELCRQIFDLKPRTIVLVDHSEFNLYSIDEELRISAKGKGVTTEICSCLASVKDEKRVERLFTKYKPAVVFHAAAYKHVPLVEYNPFEAAANNVVGTLILAQAASRHGAERFTLISTDKAVRPTNFMGASKRLAEQIIQAMAIIPKNKTVFSMVRFGNVLGSSGSVVPLFQRQIAEGGPVTITHRDVVRYFMTIPEAVGLVLQASQMATGGEVFLLDMGKPVKIMDLARKMIRLSGFTEQTEDNPDGEIKIIDIGLRPGEKLYEELLINDNPQTSQNPHIMMAHEDYLPWSVLSVVIERLKSALENEDLAELEKLLPRIKNSGNSVV